MTTDTVSEIPKYDINHRDQHPEIGSDSDNSSGSSSSLTNNPDNAENRNYNQQEKRYRGKSRRKSRRSRSRSRNRQISDTSTCAANSVEQHRKRSSLSTSLASVASASQFKCNVDYFSHNWDEFDLKNSWSLMTKHKRTYFDGVRLENASWRKWIQKKFGLRKIRPEVLRWQKDNDITWLYGPFCEARFNTGESKSPNFLSSDVDGSPGGFRRRSNTSQALLLDKEGVNGSNISTSENTNSRGRSGTEIDGYFAFGHHSYDDTTMNSDSLDRADSGVVRFDCSPGPVLQKTQESQKTAMKSAMKKSKNSIRSELKRAQALLNDKISSKFLAHSQSSCSELHGSDSLSSVEEQGKMRPSERSSLVLVHSDTDLYKTHAIASSHCNSPQDNSNIYLKRHEEELLKFMDSKLAADDNEQTLDTLHKSAAKGRHDGVKTREISSLPTKKNPKLRFSNEVKVVEYDSSDYLVRLPRNPSVPNFSKYQRQSVETNQLPQNQVEQYSSHSTQSSDEQLSSNLLIENEFASESPSSLIKLIWDFTAWAVSSIVKIPQENTPK